MKTEDGIGVLFKIADAAGMVSIPAASAIRADGFSSAQVFFAS